ncbi:hypothetical protein SEUCBS140593_001299 [Sporothrix eucalyptigena]|uniref:Beta-galactosidase n=1 Tax=Sporothrix eucalyptigena TaxID=1812306 RepID=A0ABP0AX46_9PEZI
MRLFSRLLLAAVAIGRLCPGLAAEPPRQHLLQDLVTFDEHSLIIRGERLFIYSGEFHPFRLPVPGLWLDVFQKIKSLGYNGVSFYTDWGLLEGQPGEVVMDGIFDLEPFFSAASKAGIYLIARPGPYINAETAAGGLPGWTLRIQCRLRNNCSEYEQATTTYLATVGRAIAKAQITEGGPVILVQPENEYSSFYGQDTFPEQQNRDYMAFVEQQLRLAGIVVPFIDNDPLVKGYWAAGTGVGAVDLYGIDAYPVRYDCGQPDVWPTIRWPTGWQTLHEEQSPTTPFAIPEFQGGSITSWGGVSQDQCAALVGPEALRVFYKNSYSFGVKLLNIYMTYGGTNWGNLGYQGGDTSYDYGASINEYRQVWREKYSEQKLQAYFFKVSPAYLTALVGNATNGTAYTDTSAVTTTPLLGSNGTNFYVIRQANWTSTESITYRMSVNTSQGSIDVPQLGGRLVLLGRDSKVAVTDYDVGGVNVVYCTADIMTWGKSVGGRRVLIIYGGEGELHEVAVPLSVGEPSLDAGTRRRGLRGASSSSPRIQAVGGMWVVNWSVQNAQQTVFFDTDDASLEIRLLWRNDAYNYWTLELPAAAPIGNYSSPSKESVIVKGGYLMRSASIVSGTTLSLSGDFNATTTVEVVFDPTDQVDTLVVNGKQLSKCGRRNRRRLRSEPVLQGEVVYEPPQLDLPDFTQLPWTTIDSLPEIQPEYNDSRWTAADHVGSTNNQLAVMTPTSLFASDYGYHQGSLIYRGHFVANGNESSLMLNVSGGWGFSFAAYLNDTFLGAWLGNDSVPTYIETFQLATIGLPLATGRPYIITMFQDHMGQDEEGPGTDAVKFPMGVLNYSLSGHAASDVTWKLTGNFGGEDYIDKVRGPKNEGATYAERQGFHLPAAPTEDWAAGNPITEGLPGPGIAFYATHFDLNMPVGYDVPLGFSFDNNTGEATGAYRVQLFVNGYQFGKFVPYLGPEFVFPVPEGVLNYAGTNYVSLTLWALEAHGAKLGGLRLEPQMAVMTSMERPMLSPQAGWVERNAY